MAICSRCEKVTSGALPLLLLAFLSIALVSAQTFVGSIGGIVTDSSGAVVPGVTVVVTDQATKVQTKAETNKDGNYQASFLNPSTYSVSFEKTGFEKNIAKDLALVMNQKMRLDTTLQPGSVQQSVTVSATATELNRTSSEIGGQIGKEDLLNLPEAFSTHGASVLNLTSIFAGVASSSADYSNPNNVSLGGGRPDTVPIIIDGLPSNMGADNTYGLVPTPDSTEQLQVLTAAFSAQYGQTGGGAILTTSRSGTSSLHGALFEYHTDQDLDALNFFTPPGTKRTRNIFNYFGGNLGGPAYIPKIYNGKKHQLFFFTDTEYTINPTEKVTLGDVPTAAELGGNFSGLTPQGTSVTVYDPLSTTTVNGKTTRLPFAGNIIPTNRIDPVGAKLAAFYPAPNCSFSTFNFCLSPDQNHTYLYNLDRVDENISDFDKVWFRYGYDAPTNYAVQYFPNAANPSALGGWKDYHAQATWAHILSPSMANEFRVGLVQENNFATPLTSSVSSIGLQGVPLTQFPSVSTTGLTSEGPGAYSRSRDRHWIWNDALNIQKGKHSIQVGAEYMRYINHAFSPGVLSGNYSFTGTFSSLPGVANTGLGVADLLLGVPATTSISTNNYEFRLVTNYASAYVQDDYKITSKLTVNLGLRWEFDGPPTEVNNQSYSFNPNIIDPNTGKPGGIQYAGISGAPSHFIPDDYKGFLPRAGFAYSFWKNTVFRGGFGMYELPSIGFISSGLTSQYSVAATFTSPDGVTPAYQLNQGVPAYSFNVGANGLPNIPSSLTKPSSNVTYQQTREVIPINQEWQFGLQHNFGYGWLGEVNYQGNHGVHLPVALQINQIAPSANCCFGIANAQSLRPYPQFLNVTQVSYTGRANYNALLVKVEHSFKGGLFAMLNYTWSKAMDDVDGPARANAVGNQNVYNLRAQYGVAMLDVPQRVTLTWVYDLPVGAGGHFKTSMRVPDNVIGHWQLTGNASFQVGLPVNVSQSNTLGLFSAIQYPNLVGNPNGNHSLTQWFNTSAFQIAPQDTLGNAPRADFFGPGLDIWNIAIGRTFPIGEHFKFKIRGEFYNAFNKVLYSSLNTTITSPAFGSVTGAMDPRVVQFSGRLTF
jgi:hypothetical protein